MSNTSRMRTPIAEVRHLGSAKSGTKHAWHMRITSAALVPLTIAFVWIVLTLVGKDYNTVRAALGSPLPAILILLFLGACIVHMQIGMRVIIEDYIHTHCAKTALLVANTFFSVAVGVACVYAVLRLSFV